MTDKRDKKTGQDSVTSRLEHAYDTMLERVRHALEELEELRDETRPRVRKALEHARERAVELGELSREEADRVAEYLQRDLSEAGEYLSRTGQELRDWLRFDLQQLESRFLDMLLRAADSARADIAAMRETGDLSFTYRTGEITGPGTLYCRHCDHDLRMHKTGHIPPCSSCNGTEFYRPKQPTGTRET